MIVVCDSTILIGLAKIGRLDLLREIFSKISIPQEVFYEVVEKEADKPGAQDLKDARWIEVIRIKDRTQVDFLMISLEFPFFTSSGKRSDRSSCPRHRGCSHFPRLRL